MICRQFSLPKVINIGSDLLGIILEYHRGMEFFETQCIMNIIF